MADDENRHLAAPEDYDALEPVDEDSYDEESQEGTTDAEMTGEAPSADFDPALPTQHSYLGDSGEEVRGRVVLEEKIWIELPLVSDHDIVLMPGQTIPLTAFQPSTISMLRNLITKDKTFGVRYSPEAKYGTTAEIYEYHDEPQFGMMFSVKAKGRQRFRVLETRRTIDRVEMGKLEILEERILPDPLEAMRLSSLDRFGPALSHRVPLTPHPPWLYNLYDPETVMKQVKKALMKNMQFQGQCKTLGAMSAFIPKDPVKLSYWVAQNLPLENAKKVFLLELNSAVQRLRYELSFLERSKFLLCRTCGLQLANYQDIFPMSLEGPQGTYVNPGGHIHETLTFYKVISKLRLRGRPSKEHSWFPGYAWTIAECPTCQCHLGWKFTAMSRGLKPKEFWGLCPRSLLLSLHGVMEEEFRPTV
ncbi:unnamed protein product [Darwinula stevensoni]|uniref:Protein cereblon n=1 Tax=Darwinula stevensoni TaxID=69355 RepID=A0A7R9A152_9CRUS|nr:unnamed protein product [Darwinula stevensoni]CAG0882700.1 unnamed protein product [Darwinula stevensoni]